MKFRFEIISLYTNLLINTQGVFHLQEYIVCYTLENEIKQERFVKEKDVNKQEVIQEVLAKILDQNSFIAKSEQGDYWINTSSIRYVRVL